MKMTSLHWNKFDGETVVTQKLLVGFTNKDKEGAKIIELNMTFWNRMTEIVFPRKTCSSNTGFIFKCLLKIYISDERDPFIHTEMIGESS